MDIRAGKIKLTFDNIVDIIRNLTLSEKEQVRYILKRNISEERREAIYSNYAKSQKEYKEGKLIFSKNIDELKKQVL